MDSETRMRAEIERRGLTISPRGACWRVHGPGVDVLVASLEKLGPEDMTPSHEKGFKKPTK